MSGKADDTGGAGKIAAAAANGQGASGPHEAQRTPKRGRKPPVLQDRVQRHIGRCLQAAYGELVSEPVPDRFVQLLQQLEKREKGH